MKIPTRISLLLLLAGLWGTGVFVVQLYSLPQLREQVASGLRVGLNEIARRIAQDLSKAYESELKQAFSQTGPVHEIVAFELRCLPDSTTRRWDGTEKRNGQWQTSPLSQLIATKVGLTYDHWSADAPSFWESQVDSIFLFYHQPDQFSQTLHFAFRPVFNAAGQMIAWKGFQVAQHYIPDRLISAYFDQEFWPVHHQRKDGIQRDFLDIRVLNEKGRQLYHSVVLAQGKMEARVPVRQLGAYLELLTIEVGFWGKDSQGVAASLHRRNLWLVSGVFAVLLLLLGLAYLSFRRSQRLAQLKTDFLANITHELKTPLTSIRLANDTLRLGRTRSPEEAKRSTEIIHQETLRLEKLWGTLLDAARMESGHRIYQPEPLELAGWWEDWKKKTTDQGALRGFELELSGVPTGQVMVDQGALAEALNILLDNAMLYSGTARQLRIQTETTAHHWQIRVQDFGIGIAARDQTLIFDRFVRLGNTEVHDVKGYGIGLSIAKAHLKAMQGRIELESEPGQGSIFTLILPLYAT